MGHVTTGPRGSPRSVRPDRIRVPCIALLCIALPCIPLLACTADVGGNAAGSSLDRWELEPIARIGSVTDAEAGFTQVDQVLIGPDEALYVPQSSDGSVRIYWPEGERVGSFGQLGEGPEEFGSLHDIGFLTDTLYLLDAARTRVVFRTVAGEVIGERPWEPDYFPVGPALIVPMSPGRFVLAPDHTALVRPGMAVRAGNIEVELRVPLLAIGPDSEIRDTVYWEPRDRDGATIDRGGQTFRIDPPSSPAS